MASGEQLIVWPDDPGAEDPSLVGPKLTALARIARLRDPGERHGVPLGFAVTTAAWRAVLRANGLDPATWDAFEPGSGEGTREPRTAAELHEAGVAARELLLGAGLPSVLQEAMRDALVRLGELHVARGSDGPLLLAVRSSATEEDLAGASYAGQYDSHLGVHGPDQLLDAYRAVLASLWSDRAISYRQAASPTRSGEAHQRPARVSLAMAVGVQALVRADLGGVAGVMFSRDPSDPAADRTVIEATGGLGDGLVGGAVDPERVLVRAAEIIVERPFGVDVPVLGHDRIRALATWGRRLEAAWGGPVDVEWAIDGVTEELVVVQCRPLVTHRPASAVAPADSPGGTDGPELARGLAVGLGTATGVARVVADPLHASDFRDGDVLVTATTDPAWLPLMQRASGIVTDHGGRTSHTAIVSRELGLLAVVGCGNATTSVPGGERVTLRCTSKGLGVVYGANVSR